MLSLIIVFIMDIEGDDRTMFEIKNSILVSNILDPLSKDTEDLKKVYEKLFKEGRYQSVETRPILDEDLISYFNMIRDPQITTTYYVTGNLSRAGLSLSSQDDGKRLNAIAYCKEMLMQSAKTNVTYLGIASGVIEDNALLNLDLFVDSLIELFNFVQRNNLHIRFAIEPLDQYAHKKNVIGTLDMTLRMIKKLENKGYGINQFILTWDAAHVALNEDAFEESIQKLSKYIYKVHFANAILNKEDEMYGDYHLDFSKGFMNLACAKEILSYCRKYIDHPIEVACEIREKSKDHCWVLEEECYKFLMEAEFV